MSTEASKSTTKFEEDIEIPDRIERSSTDILEALASTVGKDYTAPHYRSVSALEKVYKKRKGMLCRKVLIIKLSTIFYLLLVDFNF